MGGPLTFTEDFRPEPGVSHHGRGQHLGPSCGMSRRIVTVRCGSRDCRDGVRLVGPFSMDEPGQLPQGDANLPTDCSARQGERPFIRSPPRAGLRFSVFLPSHLPTWCLLPSQAHSHSEVLPGGFFNISERVADGALGVIAVGINWGTTSRVYTSPSRAGCPNMAHPGHRFRNDCPTGG